MKMTVSNWTQLQNFLDFDHNDDCPIGPEFRLWELIESKTFGKRYQAEVSIALNRYEPGFGERTHKAIARAVSEGVDVSGWVIPAKKRMNQ